jgi:5'-nucleotidase
MILLTNDDGIEAPGIYDLADALTELDDVTIVAPATEKSGVGHAITLRERIRIRHRRHRPETVSRIEVGGTPADAVKFALRHHFTTMPDLIVSGPNTGPNVGVNVHYSGTLGAAFEGAINGVSAVAVSSDMQADWRNKKHKWNWEACCHFAKQVVGTALSWEAERRDGYYGHPRRHPEPPFVLNLNVPALPLAKINGLRITRHGMSGFEEYFVPHPDEADHYTIDGDFHTHDPSEDYDTAALMAGYASLTPLQLDMTHTAMLGRLHQKWG